MNWLIDWARMALVASIHLSLFFTFLHLLERCSQHGGVSAQSQIRSICFWTIQTAVSSAVLLGMQAMLTQLGARPLVILPLRNWFSYPSISWAAVVLCPIVGFIVYDFFQYWMHRAQHKFFWAQHSVHHSIEELSAVNSYFHWSEDFIRSAFIGLPMAILINVDGVTSILLINILNSLHGLYLHSPTGIHFGSHMRHVFADNRWHRIHHSRHEEHFDRNFGAFTTLWDQLFGTAYFPSKDEWPECGVEAQSEPKTIVDYVWWPFGRSRSAPAHVMPSAG